MCIQCVCVYVCSGFRQNPMGGSRGTGHAGVGTAKWQVEFWDNAVGAL